MNPDLSIAESAYNAGGMVNNCSGGKTSWGTVLTGEESTATLEAVHGFIWEVDVNNNTNGASMPVVVSNTRPPS